MKTTSTADSMMNPAAAAQKDATSRKFLSYLPVERIEFFPRIVRVYAPFSKSQLYVDRGTDPIKWQLIRESSLTTTPLRHRVSLSLYLVDVSFTFFLVQVTTSQRVDNAARLKILHHCIECVLCAIMDIKMAYNYEEEHIKYELGKLRKLLENINWEIEEERHEFRRQLSWIYHLYEGKPGFPALRGLFQKKEFDLLLGDTVKRPNGFCILVAHSGYKDQPDLDADGRPVTRCTTALHHAVRCGVLRYGDRPVTDYLFSIYDRFDVNYVDEDGLTHLHVACKFGRVDLVEKFLKAGADPNCVVASTGESTLHFALQISHDEGAQKPFLGRRHLFRLLLKYGANPNQADHAEGQTPLHIVCKKSSVEFGPSEDWFLPKMLFSLCNKKYRPVQVNARDRLGNTPLNLALKSGNGLVVPLLLNNGADLNLSDVDGVAPKDIAGENLANMFSEKCAIEPSWSS
ncbi:unnamed protein product [Trichogramma brassicae]|uniref:Uncharacterized protein n=1 Tax=Trichogramma brassicae TaxID=86971 RepID=A0A6H5I796_9HYME|nr:unnamed protein product [Trichogramma brassicae]